MQHTLATDPNRVTSIAEKPTKKLKVNAPKIIRRPLSGVLLLNKPLGISSNAALQKIRWLYRADKGGHTGALDPLATGLLPICLGEATKFSHYLLDSDKSYRALIQLGTTTTTADREGEVLQTFAIPALSETILQTVFNQFLGPILQVPPMYSALKSAGKPLYELARQGIEIERPARPVHIFALSLVSFTDSSITVDVTCSKGTYIRTLAEDIGTALGSGAHLAALHRTQTGPFVLDEHITIDYVESLSEAERDSLLLPTYAPVEHLPKIQLDHGEDFYFCRGQAVMVSATQGEALAFTGPKLLGLGLVDDERQFHPKRIINYPA